MGRTPKTLAVLAVPPGADEAETPQGGDFEAFLSEIGADGSTVVRIERKAEDGPNVGKWGFCSRRQATGSILEDVQREFGAGTYRLRYTDVNTGQIKGQKDILINAPFGQSPGGASFSGVSPAESRMDRIERALEAALLRPTTPATSPLDDLVKLTDVVSKLLPQDTGRGADRALDMYLRGRDEGEKTGRAIAAVAGGGDGEGDALLRIGLPLVEMAKQQMDLMKQNPAAASQPIRPTGDEMVIPGWVRALRPYVRDLLARARMGRDPAVYAAMIVEDMPDEALPEAAQLVGDPDFPRQFLSAFPDFNETVEMQHWVRELVAAIRAQVADAMAELAADDAGEVGQVPAVDHDAQEVVNG
jgi:hypothetical protein